MSSESSDTHTGVDDRALVPIKEFRPRIELRLPSEQTRPKRKERRSFLGMSLGSWFLLMLFVCLPVAWAGVWIWNWLLPLPHHGWEWYYESYNHPSVPFPPNYWLWFFAGLGAIPASIILFLVLWMASLGDEKDVLAEKTKGILETIKRKLEAEKEEKARKEKLAIEAAVAAAAKKKPGKEGESTEPVTISLASVTGTKEGKAKSVWGKIGQMLMQHLPILIMDEGIEWLSAWLKRRAVRRHS